MGKLADMVVVEGNPLEDIANGRVYELDQLLKGSAGPKPPTSATAH